MTTETNKLLNVSDLASSDLVRVFSQSNGKEVSISVFNLATVISAQIQAQGAGATQTTVLPNESYFSSIGWFSNLTATTINLPTTRTEATLVGAGLTRVTGLTA